jgi:hypothetical protein
MGHTSVSVIADFAGNSPAAETYVTLRRKHSISHADVGRGFCPPQEGIAR